MKQALLQLAEAILNRNDIPVKLPTTPDGILSNILSTVYFWAGIIAVGLIVYGGFMYVISNGDPGRVKKAKDTLLYAVIGLIVVLVAFVITNLVIKGVNGG